MCPRIGSSPTILIEMNEIETECSLHAKEKHRPLAILTNAEDFDLITII